MPPAKANSLAELNDRTSIELLGSVENLTLLDRHAWTILPLSLLAYIILQVISTSLSENEGFITRADRGLENNFNWVTFIVFGSGFCFALQCIMQIARLAILVSGEPNKNTRSMIKIHASLLVIQLIAGSSNFISFFFNSTYIDPIGYDNPNLCSGFIKLNNQCSYKQ